MEQHRDKWWQIRLSNVLVSTALFGLALALARLCLQLNAGTDNVFGVFALAVGSVTSLCAGVGGLFGRFKDGALLGIVLSLLFWTLLLSFGGMLFG